MPQVIHAARVVTPGGVITPGLVRIEGGTIAAVEHAAALTTAGATLAGAVLMPGFIDLHTHGYGGHGFEQGASETREAARLVARTGVTTCYAALGAGASTAVIAAETDTGGARLAGI